MGSRISRRDFLTWLGAAGAGAAVGCQAGGPATPPAVDGVAFAYDPLKAYPYRGWEDLYRQQVTWD